MKKSELRNLDTNHIPVQRLTGLLETFALKHSAKLLPDILERAEQGGRIIPGIPPLNFSRRK